MSEILQQKGGLDRPLFWHGLAFTAGIGAGLYWPYQDKLLIGLATIGVLAGILAVARKIPALFLIASLVVGIIWAAGDFRETAPFPYEINDELTLSGIAVSKSLVNEKGISKFFIDPETVNNEEYQGGNLLVYSDSDTEITYGDRIIVSGKIMPIRSFNNTDSFDYQQYLLQNDIAGIISAAYGGNIEIVSRGNGNAVFRLAARVERNLESAFARIPADQAKLLYGIFFGDTSRMETAEKNILIQSGIMHAFAVSGMNIAYILIFVLLIIGPSRQRRWFRFALGSVMMIFYLSLVGFGPSVLRAAIMAFVGLWAITLDEKPDPYVSLAIAAVLLLFWRPAFLLNAGFQLSFSATFGIFYLWPVFAKILPAKPILTKWLTPTLGPSWMVMPLVAFYFHIASFIGWLASPVLLLVIGAVIVISFVVAVIAIFSPFLASIPLFFAGLLMELVYRFSYFLAQLPFSWMTVGTPGIKIIIVYYLTIIALPYLARKLSRLPLAIIIIGLVFLIVIPLDREKNAEYAALSGEEIMEVDYLDVGQGDCVLIITPEDKMILIDGGGNDRDDDDRWIGENVLMPYLRSQGINAIDFIVSSHPHSDHISGLITVLESMPVGYFLTSRQFEGVNSQEIALSLCEKNGAEPVYLNEGDKYPLTASVTLEVFAPEESKYMGEDLNDKSLVIKLSYLAVDFLFTGDSGEKQLTAICDEDIGSEVLKIPHHGSISSYCEDFYRAVDPKAVVISVGEGNSYGHPDNKIISYWRKENVPLYRTDKNGEITFLTDGYYLEIITNQ